MLVDRKDCILMNNKNEYAKVQINNKKTYLHRTTWEIHNNQKIPKGLLIRHLCHQKACVNPKHLVTGTHKDNLHDTLRDFGHYLSKRTHCPQGHEYSEENTYKTKKGGRACRTCLRKQKYINTKKRRAAAKALKEAQNDNKPEDS